MTAPTSPLPSTFARPWPSTPPANVAIVSVPGPFAALEGHKALTAGLGRAAVQRQRALSTTRWPSSLRARDLGRLVMGPGAGTAMLGRCRARLRQLAWRRGPVGIVAAAGTGAQEVMSLLSRWGVGVSHVIGVGGRDLSPAIGGLMAESALQALDADDGTTTILLVSKPPSPAVAERLAAGAGQADRRRPHRPPGQRGRPAQRDRGAPPSSRARPRRWAWPAASRPTSSARWPNDLADRTEHLPPQRTRLVGLFSGGTLCYEAMTIAVPHLGPIWSNTPLDKAWTLDTAPEGAHVCIDLGEEEYTRGRPHPMIDPAARVELLARQLDDPSVAAVLLDVVLGDGAHPDPASFLAPMAAKLVASGVVVIAYVLGTELDPQGFAVSRRPSVTPGAS